MARRRTPPTAANLEMIRVVLGEPGALVQLAGLVAVIHREADGEDAMRDEIVARPDLLDKVVEAFREGFRRQDGSADVPLTQRELEILRLVATGQKNREIAAQLVVTEQTVKNHLSRIMHKLGVPNRTHAVTFAVRQGWLTLEEVADDAWPSPFGETLPTGVGTTGDR
jgi:DNA-binding CsgD family transcriptional regulator